MQKFPRGQPPTTLCLDTRTKHYQKLGIYLVGGPNFYGTGDNRELLTEYALSTAGEQFRWILKNGHCSAFLGCGGARDALPV